jgi:hypothetical protein
VKEKELGVAVIEKREEARKAAAMARAVAIKKESKILTGWLKEVSPIRPAPNKEADRKPGRPQLVIDSAVLSFEVYTLVRILCA